MRTDLTLGYALTALFMVSMLIIGAELLFGTGTSISDEEGLLALVDPCRTDSSPGTFCVLSLWAVATGPCSEMERGATSSQTVSHTSARCRRRHPITYPKEHILEDFCWMSFPPKILLAL